MVMVTENSAQEVANYLKENAPKEEPKEEPKVEAKAEPEPKPEAKDDDEDKTPDFIKYYGLTPEQNEKVTASFKKAIGQAVGQKIRQQKEAEDFAASQYNERRLAEERAERATRELEELRKAAQPPAKEAERPDRTKFTDQNAYEDALLAWNKSEAIREFKLEQAKEREEARKEQIMEAAKARVAKALELVPDFEEVTSQANDIIPSHIAAYMQESELFPELGYHFAQHPEDLQRLAAMPSRTYSDLLKVGVALDKIESKIQPFAKAKANDATKASTNGHAPSSDTGSDPSKDTGTVPSQPRTSAPVIQPLNVGSVSQVEKPVSKMTYEESKRQWEKTHRRDFSRRDRH